MQNRFAILHAAKSPIHGLFGAFKFAGNVLRGFSEGLQNRFAILHAAKTPVHGLFGAFKFAGNFLRSAKSTSFGFTYHSSWEKSGKQKKARQVLEGPAEGGLRNKVEQWNPASTTHGKCPVAKKQSDSKAKRRPKKKE
ncbi:MAG: hypothetical protein J6X11_13130 [Treponema sp.]|nr:hypothetical protein [Treponema sp.]